ncbi:MAG: hypothetical protein ACI9BW_003307 [Gammaproteobacteria bacterium]|jgi:hypothetical protein
MALYSDSELSIRAPLDTAHQQTLASFCAAGRYWSAKQRVAIVAAARDARCETGLQDQPVQNPNLGEIPAAAEALARQIAVSTNNLDRSFYDRAITDGLRDAEYCEIVGVVARAVNLDVFARGIGVPPRKLAEPGDEPPSRMRPETLLDEGAWTQTIPGGRRGKQEAIDTYGTNAVEGAPFIYRALSLVPEEAQDLIALGTAQYVAIENFMDLNFTYDPSINRTQVELLASRVSAINECFY